MKMNLNSKVKHIWGLGTETEPSAFAFRLTTPLEVKPSFFLSRFVSFRYNLWAHGLGMTSLFQTCTTKHVSIVVDWLRAQRRSYDQAWFSTAVAKPSHPTGRKCD